MEALLRLIAPHSWSTMYSPARSMISRSRIILPRTMGSSGPAVSQVRSAASESGPVVKGKIAKKIPKNVKLEAGKKYSWCACGLSRKQPFCDGSHSKDPTCNIKPVHFEVSKTGNYWLCRCKQTSNRPYCDLTHVKTFIPAGVRNALGIKL